MTAQVLIVSTAFRRSKPHEKLLRDAGHVVRIATSAADGLALCRQGLADIVILEGEQPGLDGFAFCRALKSDPALRHVAVGLMTPDHQPRQRFLSVEAQADECLSFPLPNELFLCWIRSLVELSGMLHSLSEDPDRRGDTLSRRIPVKALILDPDPRSRVRLEEILSAERGIVTAGRAEDAVACMAQEAFGIVLADWRHLRHVGPVGALLAQQLRMACLSGSVRLVGLGDSLEDRADDRDETMLDGFLVRPVDRNETLARVRIAARKQALGAILRSSDNATAPAAQQIARSEWSPSDRKAA